MPISLSHFISIAIHTIVIYNSHIPLYISIKYMGPIMASAAGEFPAKLTFQVVLCSIIAASGGLMFGYDIGISGGVTSMDDFLEKFFPRVYERKHRAREDNYCKFDDQLLQLFTSSLYLSAMVCCWVASLSCRKYGRKLTMQMAAFFFFLGVVLNACAADLYMLIAGRILLGAGVGFANQAVPLFISEIAPARYRGGLNVCFQLLITVGILIANLVNYWTSSRKPFGLPGWRVSLGGAAVPAILLGFGSLFITETPTSLIERGNKDQGLQSLKRIRGLDDVAKEFDEIVRATEISSRINHPFRNLFMKKSSWPMLFCGTILQVFQQFTGINVVMFYAPVLFQTMGFGSKAALLSAVITGSINVASTLIAVFGVDKFGRRKLLMVAACKMLVSQLILGIILNVYLKSTNMIPTRFAYVVVALICVFVFGFAYSWGPLGWLIASEIYPLETRTAGFFCAVSTNMIFTFIIAQAFLTMLCHLRAGIFYFFVVWIVIMGAFAKFLLPETKGIPIDEMNQVWMNHWFWRRFFSSKDRPQEDRC